MNVYVTFITFMFKPDAATHLKVTTSSIFSTRLKAYDKLF